MKIDRIGETHTTNEGYEVEIIEYTGVRKCTIRFKCGLIVRDLQYGGVKDGRIKYPFHPSVFGVGYFGIGEYYQKREGVHSPAYNTWKNMLERCYGKKRSKKDLVYLTCTVDKRWHNFQVFAEWFEEKYKEGFQLDKDILKKGNKIYSPETCCFVPPEINTLFINCKANRGSLPIGVIKHKEKYRARISRNKRYEHIGVYNTSNKAFQAYKTAKEEHIKEKANEWKDRVEQKVYEAMYNWVVEITD